MAKGISRYDIDDAEVVDAVELKSTGSTAFITGVTVVSTTSSTKRVVASGTYFVNDQSQKLEPDDLVTITGTSGGLGDGTFTVDSVVDDTTFVVKESIGDSTGGTASVKYPPGSLHVGVDTANFINSTENNNQKVLEDLDRILVAPEVTGEPTGFPNRTDSTIAFSVSSPDRTFSISPVSGSFYYYSVGVRYSHSSPKTVQIDNTTGLHFIYFDGATLSKTMTWTDNLILGPYVIVGMVYWNAVSGQAVLVGDERHGLTMDGRTHLLWHTTLGALLGSGLSLGNYTTTGNGDSNSHAQCSITDGVIYDEDIKHSIVDGSSQDLSPIAYIPVWYLNGNPGIWKYDAATAFPVKQGSARIAYNLNTGGTWSQPDAGNTNYVAMWLIATNSIVTPVVAILGQREDNLLTSAKNNNVYSALSMGGFPTPEFRALYRLLFQTSNTYGNTPHARLVDVQDWRSVSVAPSNYTPTDHNVLTGRDSLNSHPASAVQPTYASFTGFLTTSDDTVQKALTTLDGSIRWLIHFIDSGPVERFASGAFLEQLPVADPFPTSSIWWESAAKLKKIVEFSVTYNANKTPNVETWKMYASDGSTVLITVTDTMTYSSIFEVSRTRTIS